MARYIKYWLVIAALLFSSLSHAYGDRPVHLLVGYPPGGPTDMLARLVANLLSDELGTPFVVENKPGVGSQLAMRSLIGSKPDGHTLMIATVANAINQSLYKNIKFDVRKDIRAIGLISSVPNLLLVPTQSPVHTFEQFLEFAKSQPEPIFYATGGTGTSAHLTGELIKAKVGINMTHVPFKGAGAALIAGIGGEVPVLVDNVTTALPHIKQGKLRALVVTNSTRVDSLPNVPTMADKIGGEFNVISWTGLVAPKDTPDSVVGTLNAALRKIQKLPAFRDGLARVDNNVNESSPQEFSDFLNAEVVKWAAAVQASDTHLD